MSKRIAVLGLGAMGLPMASHLAKTFEVTGFDPFEERRTLAAEHGVAVADSAPVAASGADFVLIAVRNAAQLEEVLHGPSGVVPVLEPGAAIILTSTVGAEAVEAEADRLAETGIGLVDAPVSGGPVRAVCRPGEKKAPFSGQRRGPEGTGGPLDGVFTPGTGAPGRTGGTGLRHSPWAAPSSSAGTCPRRHW